MYRSYPSLFKGKGICIESRSSSVPRCILSMAAFNERLKELNPQLNISRTTNQRCQQYMIPSQGRKNISLDVKKVTRPEMVKAAKMVGEEIAGKIFTCDFQRIADSTFISLSQFTRALYDVVSTMQDTEGDLRLDDVFTTGSTVMACAEEIFRACEGDVTLSVATLALSRNSFDVR